MHGYLIDRKHITKISNSFHDFSVTSYADDMKPYSNGNNVVTVLEDIETKWMMVFNWFSMNHLKANPDTSQHLLISKKESSIIVQDTAIKHSSSKKLLGVLIVDKLIFNI